MRPHHILEDMDDVEALLGKSFAEKIDSDVWIVAKKQLALAVTFDFAHFAPSEEHVEFGMDLAGRGLYRPPFPVTFFNWRSNDRDQGLIVSEDAEMQGTPHYSFIVIGTSKTDRNGGEEYRVPVYMCLLNKADPWDSGAPYIQVMKGFDMHDRDGVVLGEKNRLSTMGRAIRFVCGATSMLMSKDVSTRIDPAPTKLNSQRAEKGKPRVGEVHTIKIIASAEHTYLEAGRSFGSHASPRLHWRRGHFRTLHRGEENQRIIPVAPSLVGANEAAKNVVPKEYKIR